LGAEKAIIYGAQTRAIPAVSRKKCRISGLVFESGLNVGPMPSRRNPRLWGRQAIHGAWASGVPLVAAALILLSPALSAAAWEDFAASEKTSASLKKVSADKAALTDKAAPPGTSTTSEKPSERSAAPVSKGAPQPSSPPTVLPPAAPAVVKRLAPPPDLTWLQDVPAQPGVRARGKAAVFMIQGDEYYQPVRAAVVKALRRRGLNVTATLRPVDSAAQYREMSQTLQLGVFIDGELHGEGVKQTARIRLRSGVSGRTIASAMFTGPTRKIVGDVNQTLWARMGGAITRSCSSAARQRRPERAPLRIEAGSPEDSSLSMRGV
jgi:hypothetical protein